MTTERAILQVRGLTREFIRRGRTFSAVDGVDLTLCPGDFIAIVGRSGNGKSTLLNLITGLLKPTSGSIMLEGNEVTALNDRRMSALRNRAIGFVTQSQTLLPNLTVIDNVILPAAMRGDAVAVPVGGRRDSAHSQHVITDAIEDRLPDVIHPVETDRMSAASEPDELEERAHGLLRRLHVDDLATCYPRELSGGEMRRVSIARALMNQPKLLIADEPTGDLDADSTSVVMHLLRQTASDDTAVLMVTHDPDALAYVDGIYRMDRGVLTWV